MRGGREWGLLWVGKGDADMRAEESAFGHRGVKAWV
jgi:hypothetical protein